MKLLPGTPVPDSSDIRTVEQDAALSRMKTPNTGALRAEFRGGLITPNGTFTRNLDAVDRTGFGPERNAELDRVLGAGDDPAHPSGGYVIALGTDRQEEYISVIPSLETVTALLLITPGDVLLNAFLVDAKAAAEIATIRAAQVEPPVSAYAVVEPVELNDAPPIPAVPVPDGAHPLDVAAPGTTITLHDDGTSHTTFPDGGTSAVTPIAPTDPIVALPPKSVVIKQSDGTIAFALQPMVHYSLFHVLADDVESGVKKVLAILKALF